MSRRAGLATALVLFCAVPATAQEEDDYARSGLYIGFAGSYAIYTELEDHNEDRFLLALGYAVNVDIENPIGFSTRVGYRVTPFFALEGQFEFLSKANFSVNGINLFKFDSWILTANSKLYLLPDRLQPFLLAGLGFMEIEVEDTFGIGVEDPSMEFAARLGGGVDYYATRNIVLSIDVSYVLPTGDIDRSDFVSFGWGLQYRF